MSAGDKERATDNPDAVEAALADAERKGFRLP